MNILALDTVTERCSVALWIDGQIVQRSHSDSIRHTTWILPMIEIMLDEADMEITSVDRIAVDIGPGSFTGVRTGIGIAQGLAYSMNLGITPVCSLQILAMASNAGSIIAAIDARMGQIYWGRYHRLNDGCELIGEVCLSDADDERLIDAVHSLPRPMLVGAGWLAYENLKALVERMQEDCLNKLVAKDHVYSCDYPGAAVLASIAAQPSAEVVSALELTPLYVRNRVTHHPG